MSDKRKPVFVFLLRKRGKKKANKIEIFPARDFEKGKLLREKVGRRRLDSCYRLRVDGRWYPKGKKEYLWWSEIRDIMFRSIKF